jgi:hypothetical protein
LVAFRWNWGGQNKTDTGKTREKPRKDQRKAKDKDLGKTAAGMQVEKQV